MLVCLGIWTEDSRTSYQLDSIAKEVNLNINRSDAETEKAKKEGERKSEKYDERQQYSEVMSAVVTARSILLQLFPPFTGIAIYTMYTSQYPVFVFSDKLKDNLPEKLTWWTEIYDIAKVKESKTLPNIDKYSWIVSLKACLLMLKGSRIINYCINVFKVIFAVLILKGNFIGQMVFASIIIFGWASLVGSLEAIVWLGKRLDLTDAELYLLVFGKSLISLTRCNKVGELNHFSGLWQSLVNLRRSSKVDAHRDRDLQMVENSAGDAEADKNKSRLKVAWT